MPVAQLGEHFAQIVAVRPARRARDQSHHVGDEAVEIGHGIRHRQRETPRARRRRVAFELTHGEVGTRQRAAHRVRQRVGDVGAMHVAHPRLVPDGRRPSSSNAMRLRASSDHDPPSAAVAACSCVRASACEVARRPRQ